MDLFFQAVTVFSFNYFILDPHKIDPPVQYARLGDTVQFRCITKKHTEWYFNDEELPSNVKRISLQNILIANVTEDNAGLYSCEHKTKMDNFLAEGKLIVLSKMK